MKMNKKCMRLACCLLAIVFLCPALGCDEKIDAIEAVSMDYPHGETRLLVQRNGDAFLFCGACPGYDKIRNGTFGISELFEQLQPRLHKNVPREDWPDPGATAGMVTIFFEDNTRRDYLIFNAYAFTTVLFDRARNNTVGKQP